VKDNKKNFNKNVKPQGKPQWDNSSFSKQQEKAPQNGHHQKNNNVERIKMPKRRGELGFSKN
jgi:hypothetical protein